MCTINQTSVSQYQTLNHQTKTQERNGRQTGEIQRQNHQQVSQDTVARVGCEGLRFLRHLTVDACPALITLAGELLLHVQDIKVVLVAADMEARTTDALVELDVEESWVEM